MATQLAFSIRNSIQAARRAEESPITTISIVYVARLTKDRLDVARANKRSSLDQHSESQNRGRQGANETECTAAQTSEQRETRHQPTCEHKAAQTPEQRDQTPT